MNYASVLLDFLYGIGTFFVVISVLLGAAHACRYLSDNPERLGPAAAKSFTFLWLIFWLGLIAISPLVWCHLLYDLGWWAEGWCWRQMQSGESAAWHPFALISALLLDGLALVLAFAPYNEWYS
jgi:hypothetical protein